MNDSEFKITRRGFLSGVVALLGLPLVGCVSASLKKAGKMAGKLPFFNFGPINRTDLAPKTFSGDNPERAHAILWGSQEEAKKEISPIEKKRLVIVGGGMSGLVSAFLLKKYSPIVLEQAERLGGNSKGESFQGIDYSIGAAYINLPELDSEPGKLLSDLGLFGKWIERQKEDPVEISGKKVEAFWENRDLKKLKKYLETLYKTSKDIPEIPFRDVTQKMKTKKLDKLSLWAHLKKVAEGEIPEDARVFLENYCRSSFGARADEISAAAGLSFLSGEFNPICYFRGGNSAISEKIAENLYHSLPDNSLRILSTVIKVKVVSAGVEITYIDSEKNIKKIISETAILSCPKFVVKRILEGIEPERERAINEIEYRAYVVGNAIVKGNIPENFYDLFFLSQKNEGAVTDVIYGGRSPDGQNTVLTLYSPLAYTGGRNALFSESFDGMKAKLESQLEKTILPYFNLKKGDLLDLRIARWGHPVPVAKPGMITSEALARVRSPFKDKVFFIEQDNWCLPAFETCVSEAYFFAPKVEAILNRKTV